MDRQARSLARRPDPGQRVRRAAVQGPPARRHRHRQYLRGLHPLARRGRRSADRGPEGMLAHTYLLRHGHAWVGVSAQRAGIEGGGMVEGMHLKVTSPERYAALSHPGDRWAFDIFSQAGRAVLARPGLLPRDGNGPPVRMLACGHSQSGSFLTTYVNAVDP